MPPQSRYYPRNPERPPRLVDRGRLTETLWVGSEGYSSRPLAHIYQDACAVALAYERFAVITKIAPPPKGLNVELLSMALAAVYPGYVSSFDTDLLDLSSPYLRPAAESIANTYSGLKVWRNEDVIRIRLRYPPLPRES